MIRIGQYIGGFYAHPDLTRTVEHNAIDLLEAVNKLMARAEEDQVTFPINPATRSQVSGHSYGGFRPQACPIGAPNSKHKRGQAVDIYDPGNLIDAWCLAHQDVLEECGIWIEHPDKTPHWVHMQNIAPRSGSRVFYP